MLRTDFSDDAAWDAICSAIQAPRGEFRAYVDLVSDREYEQASFAELVHAATAAGYRSFMFVVDHTALTHPEHPVAVLDLYREPGRFFRVIPSEIWGVENNLSIANMDFHEFADAASDDGIFRGFPEG